MKLNYKYYLLFFVVLFCAVIWFLAPNFQSISVNSFEKKSSDETSNSDLKDKNLKVQIISHPDSVLQVIQTLQSLKQRAINLTIDSIINNGNHFDKFFVGDKVSEEHLIQWLQNDTNNLNSWVKNCNAVKFKAPQFAYSLPIQELIWKKFQSDTTYNISVLDYLSKNFKNAEEQFLIKLSNPLKSTLLLNSGIILQLSKKSNIKAFNKMDWKQIAPKNNDQITKNLALSLLNFQKTEAFKSEVTDLSLNLIAGYPIENFLKSKNKNTFDYSSSDILASLILKLNPEKFKNELYYFVNNNIYPTNALINLNVIDPEFVKVTLKNWSMGKAQHYNLPKTLFNLNQHVVDTNLLKNYLNYLKTTNYSVYPLIIDDIALLFKKYKISPSNFISNLSIPDTSNFYQDILFTYDLYQFNTEYYLFELLKTGLIDSKKCYQEINKVNQDIYSSIANSLKSALTKTNLFCSVYLSNSKSPINYNQLVDYLIKHSQLKNESLMYDFKISKLKNKYSFDFIIIFNNKVYQNKSESKIIDINYNTIINFINFVLHKENISEQFNIISKNDAEMYLYFGNPANLQNFFSRYPL